MSMPPNPSNANQLWWFHFHTQYGKDSAPEKGFLGWLDGQGLHPQALTPDELDAALAACQAFVAASQEPPARQAPVPEVPRSASPALEGEPAYPRPHLRRR